MKMKIVNPYLVAAIFEPFMFLSDDDLEEIAAIDPEDERKVRACIRKFLVPYYSEFDERSKVEIRDSLAYMLINGSNKWGVLLQMNQSPLSLPATPQKLFEWIWSEFYQCDVHFSGEMGDYVVKEDIYAANIIKRGRAV